MLGLHNKRLFGLVQLASCPCDALGRTCIQDLFFCDDGLLALAHALLLYLESLHLHLVSSGLKQLGILTSFQLLMICRISRDFGANLLGRELNVLLLGTGWGLVVVHLSTGGGLHAWGNALMSVLWGAISQIGKRCLIAHTVWTQLIRIQWNERICGSFAWAYRSIDKPSVLLIKVLLVVAILHPIKFLLRCHRIAKAVLCVTRALQRSNSFWIISILASVNRLIVLHFKFKCEVIRYWIIRDHNATLLIKQH